MIFIDRSGCGAAPSSNRRPHRLAGPGQRPFTPSTGVQIPLGTPNEIKGLHENVALFSYVGQICPTLCPTDLENFLKTIMIAPKGALRERTIEYQRGAC